MKNIFLSALFLSLSGCAPKIYIIDRQTVLEQESAGEWPEFEQDLVKAAPQSETTAFPKLPISASRERLYNLLNGELK